MGALLILGPAARAQATLQDATPASAASGVEVGADPARSQASGASPRGMLLDAVVATVDDVLITRSDLVFEARVHALDLQGAAALSRSLTQEDLREALERSLSERLHAREAERLGVVPPTPQELEVQLALLEGRAGGAGMLEAFLRVHGADGAQLVALLQRGELSARAKESRVRVRAQVTEAEIRRAWEASGSTASLAEDREALALRLRSERAREVEARELERLLRNARVRRIAPWARQLVGQGR